MCFKELFPMLHAVWIMTPFRGKYAYKHIIDDFEKGIIDILVGTNGYYI